MREIFLLFFLGLSIALSAQTDSIQSVNLQEVTVTADQKAETPTHTVLFPSPSDKAHSANAFDLIHTMSISDLNISFGSRQISNHRGQEVVLCINGIEVSAKEVAALRSKNIISVEYQRNPTGKYLGKGGVLNFKTVQYDYGGNVYLSAKESFLYNNGDYLASADYTRKQNRLSLIYGNNWDITRNKQTINNQYYFDNGNTLWKNSEIDPIESKNLSNAINLRYSCNGDNYRFSVIGGFADTHTPYNNRFQRIDYSGSVQGASTTNNTSGSYGNAFSLNASYTRWLLNQQVIDFTVSAASGKNNYRYLYQETHQNDINWDTKENNLSLSGTFQYLKTLKNRMGFSTVINHYTQRFNDRYSGSLSDKQILENHVSSATLQLSKSTSKLFFYATAGISNMNIRQNENRYNYLNPTGYYGITYSPQSKLSLSLNGLYAHTIFDPSNKNSLSVPVSFFEVTRGNPDLKPINVLSNTLELNYNWGKTSLTVSYMNYIYFNNILHIYEVDDSYIYTRFSNDGNFYGNMLIVTLTQRLLDNKLKISLTGIEEYNAIKGQVYYEKKNVLRGRFQIDYTVKKMRIGTEVSTPHKALDIREPFFVKKPTDMSLYAIWDWTSWRLETSIRNPFSKYAISERWINYPCFDMNTKDFDLRRGRSISVKVVFNFSYGKKSQPEEHSVERSINSAILKSY